MTPELKKRWVEALRSGKYTQGVGYLKHRTKEDPNKFEHCCLGVLCELYAEDHPDNPEVRWVEITSEKVQGVYGESKNIGSFGFLSQDETAFLPHEVCEWAGLDNNDPSLKYTEDEHKDASGYNDDGYTFTDIANAIELTEEL